MYLALIIAGIPSILVIIPFLVFLCTQDDHDDDNNTKNNAGARNFEDPTLEEEKNAKTALKTDISHNLHEDEANADDVFRDNMDEISENGKYHVINTGEQMPGNNTDEENPSSNANSSDYSSSSSEST